MACYHPITGYRSKHGRDRATGKWPVVFKPQDGYIDMPVTLPCGQCIGCRLERSRQWAARCVHESQLHDTSCFITLTYAPEHLPVDNSLDKSHFQKFLKRLRKKYNNLNIRYFHCGEYGELLQRPHYHAILFGIDFTHDRILYTAKRGVRLYISPDLSKLWPFGFSTIGDVTFESAAYVARYCTKKITGSPAKDHYAGRLPEYTTMSLKPGIGAGWLTAFKSDVYPSDTVVIRDTIKVKPARYYDQLYDKWHPEEFEKIRIKRQQKIAQLEQKGELTPQKLKIKETIKLQQFKKLKRGYEQQ